MVRPPRWQRTLRSAKPIWGCNEFLVMAGALTAQAWHDEAVSKSLLARKRVGHEIAQDRAVGKRIEHNDAGAQFRDAGIFHLAIDKDQAFLADIGVKAAESNREIGIVFRPDAHQAVQ